MLVIFRYLPYFVTRQISQLSARYAWILQAELYSENFGRNPWPLALHMINIFKKGAKPSLKKFIV